MMLDCIGNTGKAVFTSFTRRAKQEAVARIPFEQRKQVDVSTLHSLSFKDLGYRPNYVLSDLSKFTQYVGEALEEKKERGMPRTRLSDIMSFIGTWRNKKRMPTMSDFPKGVPYKLCQFVVNEYADYKDREAYVDYTDFLCRYIEKGKPLKANSFFVDEAQDLTKLQWQAIEKMARECSLFAVFGDDDQAIYDWAGSEAKNLIEWQATSTSVLAHSHRLTEPVYKLSQDIIRQVSQRHFKDFKHNNQAGGVSRTATIDFQHDFDGYDTVGILYRNYGVAEWVREELHKRGILYGGVDSPYERKDDVQAILDWEHWRSGKKITGRQLQNIARFSEVDFEKYDGQPSREILQPCPSQLPWHEIITLKHSLVYRKLFESQGIEGFTSTPKITMSTIHNAKGGEWDKVILLTDMQKTTYDEYSKVEGKDHENRVWYVGSTRAKKHLQIIRPKRIRHYALLANYPLERLT